MLPITLERATRSGQMLLSAGKEYVCFMKLHADVSEEKVREVLQSFVGTITQMPPVKSAVKRQLRERNIYYLNVLETDGRNVLFRVGSQAGTYIRTICVDAGKKLGIGAHMQQLIRTKAGPFTDKDWVTLQDLQDAYSFWKEDGDETLLRKYVTPFEKAAEHLPKVWVFDSAVHTICSGAEVYVSGISRFNTVQPKERVAIMTLKGELIGLGAAAMETGEIQHLQKGVAVKPDAIFMDRNVYPKQEKKA